MRKIGAMYICNICGKEEFLKETNHYQLSGGWGCTTEYDTSAGWIYKSKLGDVCPECSSKLKDELILKYGITEDHCKCYLENFQDAYTCHRDALKCPKYNKYDKCAEIANVENHGSIHGL